MKQYLLRAVGVRNYDGLTLNKEYKTLNGIEDGILPDKPFVTIINDYGKEHSCHFQRFEVVKEIEENIELVELITEIYDIFEKNDILKEKLSLSKTIKELKCEHINIAVYDENDTDKLVSLIYYNEDFNDDKDIVLNSDNLFYVSDIIHNIYLNYSDINAESIVANSISYLADIIIFDRVKKDSTRFHLKK